MIRPDSRTWKRAPSERTWHYSRFLLSLVFLGDLGIPDEERPWVEAAVALHHKNLFSLTAAGHWFYYHGDLLGDGQAF